MTRAAFAALLFASALDAQVVAVPYDPNGARLLVACHDSLPDDVLWNLDRADQLSGVLDGRFKKRIDGTGSVIYVIDSGIFAAHDDTPVPTGRSVS